MQFVSQSIIEKVNNPMRYKKLEILYNNEKHFLGKNLGQNIFSIWKTER